jgi:hypothetical protein
MTAAMIDLSNVDTRPAHYVLGLVRTCRLTLDPKHLDQVAGYLNRDAQYDPTLVAHGPVLDEDGAINLAIHVVLGAGLDYQETVRALRLPTTPDGGRAGQDDGARVRAEMCDLMPQAA